MGSDRTVDVTITIEKADGERLEGVVRALRAAGLKRVDVHERFLVVNGSVAADSIGALRKIKGVASVRESQNYKPQTPLP